MSAWPIDSLTSAVEMSQVYPPRGHNSPPSLIDLTRDVAADLSRFLAETPVISDSETARAGAQHVKRVRNALADLDDERKAKTGPLNDQVAGINATYRDTRVVLERALEELRERLTVFAHAEEDRRLAVADAKQREVDAAAANARVAIQAERDARENASLGEVGVDVVAASLSAGMAVAHFDKAARVAARAERDVTVRITPGLGGRAIGLRSREVLTLVDAAAALAAIGPTERITEAILTDAKAYRKLHGVLPPGITSTPDRSI